MIVEDLEGRRLLSQGIQSVFSQPASGASNIVSGPDGDLWAGVNPDSNTAEIERIGLDGSVTTFPVPANSSVEFAIDFLTTGPDGNVWFVANFADKVNDNQVLIGNITPAGLVTEFPPIPVPAGKEAEGFSIVSGPGGDLWFGYSVVDSKLQSQVQNEVFKVSTAGAIRRYWLPTAVSSGVLTYLGSADGSLWFADESGVLKLDRSTASGVATSYKLPSFAQGAIAFEASMAVGQDGNLYVLDNGVGSLGDSTTVDRVSPSKLPRAH